MSDKDSNHVVCEEIIHTINLKSFMKIHNCGTYAYWVSCCLALQKWQQYFFMTECSFVWSMWVLRTLNLMCFNLHDFTVPHMYTGCTNFMPLHSVKMDNKFYCYMILENCHICLQFCVCVSSNNNSQQFCNVHCLQWMLQTYHTFPWSSQNNLETSKLYDDWVFRSSWTWSCAVWCVVHSVSKWMQ